MKERIFYYYYVRFKGNGAKCVNENDFGNSIWQIYTCIK